MNWTHANALSLHPAGLVLVSMRNLSQVVAINRATGAVAWKLGGVSDDFRLASCCAPMFARQHGLRLSSTGHIALLDNLGKTGDSRVQLFTVDAATRTATLVRSHSAQPPVVASLGGSVQLQPNGNILAAFGDGRRVEEIDAAGNVVWRITGDPGYIFRAQRIASLYSPGVGTAR